jgi:hypothetical protein
MTFAEARNMVLWLFVRMCITEKNSKKRQKKNQKEKNKFIPNIPSIRIVAERAA